MTPRELSALREEISHAEINTETDSTDDYLMGFAEGYLYGLQKVLRMATGEDNQ